MGTLAGHDQRMPPIPATWVDAQRRRCTHNGPLRSHEVEPQADDPSCPSAARSRGGAVLDLDGSLLEFAALPSQVIVPDSLRSILFDLHPALDGALAVLSGRSLAQIDSLLNFPGLVAVGIHGSE